MFEAIIRNGLLMAVAALILAVLGILAALRIPVQMIPDLEVRTVSVQTSWPGATPQDIEKEILIEQEEYLRTVPNLQRLSDSSGNPTGAVHGILNMTNRMLTDYEPDQIAVGIKYLAFVLSQFIDRE